MASMEGGRLLPSVVLGRQWRPSVEGRRQSYFSTGIRFRASALPLRQKFALLANNHNIIRDIIVGLAHERVTGDGDYAKGPDAWRGDIVSSCC